LARGYFNRADLTVERFIADPFSSSPGGRLYRTGDVACYLKDGNIDFIDRLDYQVKIRGFRVELGEVEEHLQQSPAIAQAAVVARDGAGGNKRLAAYVVCKRGQSVEPGELRNQLLSRLPEYMIPSTFVTLDQLPRTSHGKIDRQALLALKDKPRSRGAYLPPRTQAERAVAAVWQEALSVDQVGLDDNFFDLGGHSLLMITARNRLQRVFDRRIPMVELFKHPTVRRLAEFLSPEEERQPHDSSAVADSGANGEARHGADGDIAVIGMSGRFPKAADIEIFWRNLCDGVEAVSFFADEDLEFSGVENGMRHDPNYVRAKAVLDEVEQFDSEFFGFNPREADVMDPQHRLALETAWHALEDAGYDPQRYSDEIGVFVGASVNTYLWNNLYPNRRLIDSVGIYQITLGNDKDFLPTRISYKLGLKGPSMAVQTGCSTSLVAVHVACRSLLGRECEIAIAGGVAVRLPQKSGYLHQPGGISSPDGRCRAFDADAQGTVSGNGVGFVVLKKLADALADGDSIHAIIKGSAVNNDGAVKVGFTAPAVDGQAAVIARAHQVAGIAPETITYVEAHGTGTPLGDPVEVAALTQAFLQRTDKKGFCALGSVKTNIGHLDAAAGVAGLIKTVMAIKHGMLPPSLHFQRPNPQIDFSNSPFYVNHTLTEWRSSAPRRAGVSSFGIGGTNAHLILEEAAEPAASGHTRSWQLLPLSARTPEALQTASANLGAFLEEHKNLNLADVAFTLQVGRRRFAHSRVVLCRDLADAAHQLLNDEPQRQSPDRHQEAASAEIAFMFPGQGSQYVNMGVALYQREAVFTEVLDRCALFLEPLLGVKLQDVLYPPEEKKTEAERRLLQTGVAQPALFVVEYALARQWMQWGVRPHALIGHSIGEYVAACLSGVFSLEDALTVVAARARLMQSLPGGAMLAAALSETETLANLDEDADLAAVNSARLCVASGPVEAIARMERHLLRQQIDSRRLTVSHAFHSRMMRPAVEAFEKHLTQVKLSAGRIPFISNLTGDWIEPGQAADPKYWCRHLLEPVRFSDGISTLLKRSPLILLEVGPGRSLRQMGKEASKNQRETTLLGSLAGAREESSDEKRMTESLGEIWLRGRDIDWSGYYANERRRRISLPTYPFQRRRHWIESCPPTPALSDAAAMEKRPNIADWLYAPCWKSAPALANKFDSASSDASMSWLLFLDSCGLGSKLRERLQQAGQRVTVVEAGERFLSMDHGHYRINPSRRDDYILLVDALKKSGDAPQRVVHLWNVTTDGVDPSQPLIDERLETMAFYSPLYLAQALSEQSGLEGLDIAFISNGLQSVNGGAIWPAKALLLGPCRTIAREHPWLSSRSIDIEIPEPGCLSETRLIGRLLTECRLACAERFVAYRGNNRWIQSYEPIRMENGQRLPPLRAGGVYLITGGLGGIGFVVARRLVQAVRAKLVLVQRTSLPRREEWEAWLKTHQEGDSARETIESVLELERQGAEILLISADVADENQMREAAAQVRRRFGHLHGVIHAAGVAGGGVISLKSAAEAAGILAPKVRGACILDRVFNQELDFFLLFSALSSIFGEFGAVDYCAANAFLDAFAHYQVSRLGKNTVSVNWDTWSEVGMAVKTQAPAGFQERRNAALRNGVSNEEGVSALERALASGLPQVVVSTRDFNLRVLQSEKLNAATVFEEYESEMKPAQRPLRDALDIKDAPNGAVEQGVAEIWQELLGVQQISVHDDFFEIGGHSLLALLMISRLRKSFQAEISMSEFFDAPTIRQVAEYIQDSLSREVGSLPDPVPLARVAQSLKQPGSSE
jgi:acyl transferase domain-containing protein/acyl carrier protein